MDREFSSSSRSRPVDFSFPIALITAGIIWLLVNNGTIAVDNLYRLVPLWPALLITAGLGLIAQRLWWPLNALVWAALAALVIWLLTTGSAFLPQLSPLTLKHETLRETIGQTTSADVNLDLSIFPTTVHALDGSEYLLTADVYTANGIILDASGGAKKNVRIYSGNFNTDNFFFNPRIDQWFAASSQPWDIGLAATIPLKLAVDASTGRTDLNLEGLLLESLRVKASTGRMDIRLPKSQAKLPVNLDMSTGGATVTIPDNTPVELTASGGTGGLQIILPEGAGAQVNVRDGGLGGVTLPDGFRKVSGSAGEKEGVWQNEAYTGAKTPVMIILDLGTGGVTIQ